MKPSSAAVLALLRERPEGITAFDALTEARCLRLAARVADLKAEGHRISTDIIPTTHGKHIALYRLHETEQREAWTPEELVTIANQSGLDVSRA